MKEIGLILFGLLSIRAQGQIIFPNRLNHALALLEKGEYSKARPILAKIDTNQLKEKKWLKKSYGELQANLGDSVYSAHFRCERIKYYDSIVKKTDSVFMNLSVKNQIKLQRKFSISHNNLNALENRTRTLTSAVCKIDSALPLKYRIMSEEALTALNLFDAAKFKVNKVDKLIVLLESYGPYNEDLLIKIDSYYDTTLLYYPFNKYQSREINKTQELIADLIQKLVLRTSSKPIVSALIEGWADGYPIKRNLRYDGKDGDIDSIKFNGIEFMTLRKDSPVTNLALAFLRAYHASRLFNSVLINSENYFEIRAIEVKKKDKKGTYRRVSLQFLIKDYFPLTYKLTDEQLKKIVGETNASFMIKIENRKAVWLTPNNF